jgi:probable F420-dependent oxidoreductase
MALKVGLFLPVDRPWTELRRMAELAEDAGFASLWLQDHLIFRRDDRTTGAWEAWTLLSALAAATRRVELGTLVLCTPFRNPALLAKMADALDEVSGGRLILGMGAGWHEPEFTAFGYPFDYRASRFEEAFTIVTTLLREGKIDFQGKFHEARDCEMLPRGPRPKGPPVLVGTNGDRMLKLTARHADLWNGCWFVNPSDLVPRRERVDAACAEVGRDPKSLGRTAGIRIDLPSKDGTAGGRPGHPVASAEQAADLFRAYAAEGIEHLQVWTDPWDAAAIEWLAPAVKLL